MTNQQNLTEGMTEWGEWTVEGGWTYMIVTNAFIRTVVSRIWTKTRWSDSSKRWTETASWQSDTKFGHSLHSHVAERAFTQTHCQDLILTNYSTLSSRPQKKKSSKLRDESVRCALNPGTIVGYWASYRRTGNRLILPTAQSHRRSQAINQV